LQDILTGHSRQVYTIHRHFPSPTWRAGRTRSNGASKGLTLVSPGGRRGLDVTAP